MKADTDPGAAAEHYYSTGTCGDIIEALGASRCERGNNFDHEYGPGGVAWWVQDPQTGAIGERVYIKEVEQVD